MNAFPVFSVANIVLVGLISSYTDWRSGKIYNKFLALGFIFGILILAVFYGTGFDARYLRMLLLNGFIAFVFSYLLWFSRKWSAGDAKLFSFFAFFLPFCYYRNSYVGHFPSINILLNAFFIIIMFMIINSFIFVTRKLLKGGGLFSFKGIKREKLLAFVKVMASYVSLMYFLSKLSRIDFLLPVVSNNMAVFFAMFFLYGPLCKNRKIQDALSVLSVFILVYLFAVDRMSFNDLIYRAVIFAGIIGAINRFFDYCMKNNETVEVKVRDLRVGQVLIESERVKVAGFADKTNEESCYNETRSYGLNASQIKIIRNLYKEEDSLLVYKTFPLGPVMFAGVLITIMTSNSVLRILIEKLRAL